MSASALVLALGMYFADGVAMEYLRSCEVGWAGEQCDIAVPQSVDPQAENYCETDSECQMACERLGGSNCDDPFSADYSHE